MEFEIRGDAIYVMSVEVMPIDPMTNPYSDYRGWVSPDGDYRPLYGVDGHTKLAKEILGKVPKDPIKALQDAGWVRIVAQNSYSCAKLDENTRRILLSSVLKNRDSGRFFVDIGGVGMEFKRDEAIEYFGGES